MSSIEIVQNQHFKNFSLFISFLTALALGYHHTSLQMIINYFFYEEQTQSKLYYTASVFFIVPIFGGILRSSIYLSLLDWIKIIFLSNSIAFIGYVFNDTRIFFISRCFGGFAAGLCLTVVPEYIGVTDKENIGFLSTIFVEFIILGIVFGQIITLLAKKMLLMKLFFFVPACFFLICAFLTRFIHDPDISTTQLPEKKNFTECMTINQTTCKPFNHTHMATQYNSNDLTISGLFKNPNATKSIVLAVLIHMAQQLSCINCIVTYSNTLLSEGDGSSNSAQIRSIIMGIFSFVVTLAISPLPERMGRKVLFQVSIALTAISLAILIYGKYNLFAVLLFQFGFAIGLGPITWLVTIEIFPVEYQRVAAPILGSVNWFCAAITVLFFRMLLDSIGPSVLWFNVAGLIIVMIVLQILLEETKNQEAKFQ